MNAVAHVPPGTKAAILRAVIHEKHPRIALPSIASRFGVTYDVVRQVIDRHGYPEVPKMREAAAALELEEGGQVNATTPTAVDEAVDEIGQLVRAKVSDLHLDPNNVRDVPRQDDESIVELADSISELGLLQPITARRDDGGRLVVVMGHRRLVAVRRLKWTTVQVIVRGAMLASDVLAAMLVENGQRRDLNPMEEARGLRRLQIDMGTGDDHEATVNAVARRVGRSQAHVSGRLALLSLSADDQAAIVAGDMSLLEGTTKGRLNSGRVGTKGVDRNWHLGPLHPLAENAKARCRRLQHSRGRTVGGMACGECWESVIRADARRDFVDLGHKTGSCAVCEQPVERTVATA